MRYFYSILQKTEEFINRKKNGNSKVFVFHRIGENSDSEYNLSVDNFMKVINYCQNNGEIKPLSQLSNDFTNNCFYITFDDIFYSAYENAMKWLEKNEIPFTVFITYNLIGEDNYISNAQLEELKKFKHCTIGSHCMNHSNMRRLKKNSLEEFLKSKELLGKKIDRKIDYLAYPYGSIFACSKTNIKLVEKAGYELAFSTLSYPITKKIYLKKRFFLPRITVTNSWISKEVK